jgi:hypothetical protein
MIDLEGVKTEVDWQSSENLCRMLNPLEGRVSDRKLMLFSIACVRRIWRLLTDRRSREIVEVAEKYVDGAADAQETSLLLKRFDEAYWRGELIAGAHYEAVRSVAQKGSGASLQAAAEAEDAVGSAAAREVDDTEEWSAAKTAAWKGAEEAERHAQLRLLRDIMGNPFRTVVIQSGWLTSEVVELAKSIYEQHTFDKMPELANALELAGCSDEEVLRHCRDQLPHARGCWVLDGILGKD